MRGSPAILIAVTIFLGTDVAFAQTSPQSCSAQFKARADWLEALDGNPDTAKFMRSRADYWLKRMPFFIDYLVQTPTNQERRDEEALTALTRLVEDNPNAVVLPTCMEDPECHKCLSYNGR
jgi:hypothetical protein